MISLKLKYWRTLGAASVFALAACGGEAGENNAADDAPTPNASTPTLDDGEGGEGGESGESGGESGESGEGGNSGPG